MLQLTPPCELLMGCPLRTRLDLLRPNLGRKVLSEQAKQKQSHDEHSKDRQFKEGDAVWIRDFRSSANKWEPGILVQRVRPVSYIIQWNNGQTCKRHVDHIHHGVDSLDTQQPPSDVTNDQPSNESPWVTCPVQPTTSQSGVQQPTAKLNTTSETALSTPSEVPRRNPPRDRRPPHCFQT